MARITMSAESTKAGKGCLTLYSAIAGYLLKLYPTDDSLVTVDTEIQTFKQEDMTEADYAQQSWTKTLRCVSDYTKKKLKALFVEGAKKPICRTLRQLRSEHQSTSLEDLAQRAELFTALWKNKLRPDNRSSSERARTPRELSRNRRRQARDQQFMNIKELSRP